MVRDHRSDSLTATCRRLSLDAQQRTWMFVLPNSLLPNREPTRDRNATFAYDGREVSSRSTGGERGEEILRQILMVTRVGPCPSNPSLSAEQHLDIEF